MPTGKEDIKVFDSVWIEPGKVFTFQFSDDELSFKPKDTKKSKGGKSTFDWNVKDTYGVTINVY